MKRFLIWGAGLTLFVFVSLVALGINGLGMNNFKRMVLGMGRGYDSVPPKLSSMAPGPAILIFSKTNGYRDDPQIVAANRALVDIAQQRGWKSFTTENGAVFNSAQLAQFDAIVWNSVSGDVLTPQQRAAFKSWLEAGHGFVALHGSGGDPSYDWKWYVDTLIGAQFIGHTMGPQFQRATVFVEDRTHPATRHLPEQWVRTDEWYSFASNPRLKGYHVLARLDERSYEPRMKMFPLGSGRDIRMGADHPVVWHHCVGKGRALYSALGHPASAYSEPAHLIMIAGAIAWAAGLEGSACGLPKKASDAG